MANIAEHPPLGTPIWAEVGIPDLARGQEFYNALFGWEFDGDQGYTMASLNGRHVAAVAGNPTGPEYWWTIYLAAPDHGETLSRLRANGGQVVRGPDAIFSRGIMTVAADAVGAPITVWQGREVMGFESTGGPGELVRTDLVTAHPQRARDFYAAVFDLTSETSDTMPGRDFTVLRRPDGEAVGGILGNPLAARSRWSTTFGVPDVDAATATARALGGRVIDVEDRSYGRCAVLLDPFGAAFSVVAQPMT